MTKKFKNQTLAKFLVQNINLTKEPVGTEEFNIDSLFEVPFLTAIEELFDFEN